MADLETGIPAAGPLTGSELIPGKQGSGAVRITANQLLSRAAGQALPFDIGGTRIATITVNGIGVGTSGPTSGIHVSGGSDQARARIAVEGNSGAAGTVRLGNSGSAHEIAALPGAVGMTFTQVGVGEWGRWSGGNFLVGQTAPNQTFADQTPGVTIGGVGHVKITRNATVLDLHRTTSDGVMVNIVRGTASVGSITVTASATSFNTSSDYRLKDEEGEISDEEALTFVEQSRPIWFRWKATGERVDGYLAHEVQAYAPNAVTGEKDAVEDIGDATGYRERDPETGVPILGSKETLTGITEAEAPEGYVWTKTGERPVHQGIDQSKLVPRLNAGLKAAVRLIRSLEDTVSALEQRIEALEAAA